MRTFKLEEVPEGRYTVVVDHPSFVPARQEIVLSQSGALVEYRIALDPGQSLTGSVKLDDDEPDTNLAIIARSADGYSRRTTVQSNGSYTLSGLIAGTYRVAVTWGGEIVLQDSADIDDGRDEKLNLRKER